MQLPLRQSCCCWACFIVSKVPLLRNYCIPAPVVGGIVYALVHLGLYAAGIATISFDGTLQSFFMTVFFCSVGFMASFKLLKKGGIQVVIFLAVSIVLVLLQDVLGTGMAAAFGLDPRLGLCIGSIPMVGGHGTAGFLRSPDREPGRYRCCYRGHRSCYLRPGGRQHAGRPHRQRPHQEAWPAFH